MGTATRSKSVNIDDATGTTLIDDILLQNGTVGRFRPVEPGDRDALVSLHRWLSDRRVYLRFIGLDAPDATVFVDGLLQKVEAGQAYSEVCLVHDRLVGVGTYLITDDPHIAETAFVVDERMHRLGIGTLLLERLADHANHTGIREFVSRVLTSDSAAISVLTYSGFTGSTFDVGGEIEFRFPLEMTNRLANAVDQRQGIANLASMNPLISPRSVAVIAESLATGSPGRTALDRLRAGGFSGPIHPVIPELDVSLDVRTYTSLHDLPAPVDLALLAVRPGAASRHVRSCADAGVRGLILLSGGFAEADEPGARYQREILAITRNSGMRLIGPDSAGIVNTAPDVRLDATTLDAEVEPGALALVTQSRSIGAAVLDQLRTTGIGLSLFVSLGNKADVSGNDLLSFLAQHDRTSVITMYVDSLGNPRRFARIARTVTRAKPVVALIGSPSRTTSPESHHTDEVAARHRRELLRQCGVIQVVSLEQLTDTSRLLCCQPLPTGRRVAVIGTSRGATAISIDALRAADLEPAELDPDTVERIGKLASIPTTVNPLVLDDEVPAETIPRIVRQTADCAGVDAVVVALSGRDRDDPVRAALRSEQPANPSTPVLVTTLGRWPTDSSDHAESPVPLFPYPESAARALGAVASYAEHRRSPLGTVRDFDELRPRAARDLLGKVLGTAPDGRWLEFDQAHQLLSCYGITLLSMVESAGEDQVLDAAHWIGYPVVLKSPVTGAERRTEIGDVRPNLSHRDAVRFAYRNLVATGALGQTGAVVVQRQAPEGVDLTAGVVSDPDLGPVVVLGAGGKNADLFDDTTWCVPPVTEVDAAAATRDLKVSPLLFGHRGTPSADVSAVEDLLERLGRLADDQPGIDELHLHVIAHPRGISVIDVAVHARTPDAHPRFTAPLDHG